MPVLTETPIVVPAQPEKVYDKLWVVMQHSSSPGFGACSLNATLRPYRVDGDVYRFSPIGRKSFKDDNLFDLHIRKPYVVEAIHARLTAMGIAVPEGVPAQLYMMEILSQVWGAAAEAVDPNPTPVWPEGENSEDSSSSSYASSGSI